MPVHGTWGTIGSRGCFEVNSGVGNSFTFPIERFTPQRFVALVQAHLRSRRSPRTAEAGWSIAGHGSGRFVLSRPGVVQSQRGDRC